VWDVLFPKKCVECGSEGGYLCDKCMGRAGRAELICPECGRRSFGGMVHENCRTKYSLDGLVIVWEYDNAIKKAIAELKFQFVSDLVRDLVQESAAIIDSDDSLLTFRKKIAGSGWMGVPLHMVRERKRGYNQADLLAWGMAEKLGGKPIKGLVLRTRLTVPQVGLNKEKRMENVRGIFQINGKHGGVIPESVVVVDDVWTTGSTLREVGRILKAGGVRQVWGVAVAR
jgi:ComF family protein